MRKTQIRINFGTDGFRGVIGDSFTFDAVKRVSASLAAFIKGKSPAGSGNSYSSSIAIGYDTRFLSKEFALSAATAINSAGIKVIFSRDFCPSPVLSYFVKKNKCEAGVMVTASHNPFMFNGIKFKSPYGSSMLQKDVRIIEKIANGDSPLSGEGKSRDVINIKDFKKDYVRHLIDFTGLENKKGAAGRIEVVFDPMFGAGIGYLPAILKKTGIRHTSINNKLNPLFPGINPEPIDINLSRLKSIVKMKGKENRFAVGFAMDGDADRIGAVDSSGNFMDSHKIFSIILYYLLKSGKSGNVVKTVSVSNSINDICERFNVKLFEVPIGFKNVAELMIGNKNNILMGGEESGGIGIASHMPERDGILMSLMLIKIMKEWNKNLSELLNEVFGRPYPYVYIRKDLHLSEEKKDILIGKLKKSVFNLPFKSEIVSRNFIDGFKYIYKDGSWLLIRPSGTEPLLRVYAESADKNKPEKLILAVEKELET